MKNSQSSLVQILVPGFRMHTQLFNNMLQGITQDEASKRINNSTNNVVWMVGNLVNNRFFSASLLKINDIDPHGNFFENGKALDPNANYPTIKDLQESWHRISPRLFNALLETTDEDLKAYFNFGEMSIPFVEPTVLNALGMSFDRESYLLGQLGLMRKLLGHPGVKYDIDPNIAY